MFTRRLLLFLPIGLIALLFQSALWVPSYGKQVSANAARSTTFIQAKIGDAKYLNPVLVSDASSGEVVSRRLFEALIETDERLEIKGRLAERFELDELAYVAAIPERKLPDGRAATAQALLETLQRALDQGSLPTLTPLVKAMRVEAASERSFSEEVMHTTPQGKPDPYEIKGRVRVPERVELELARVTPRLFDELRAVLGADYFENYPFKSHFQLSKPTDMVELEPKLPQIFPVGEHNPRLTFYLRKNARFHDGKPLTSADVRATYLALIDGKAASPRAGSFEPVRVLNVLDPYTVEVIYKRLYAGALVDWMLEIVPEHLTSQAALEREMDERKLPPSERAGFSLRRSRFNQNPIGSGPFRFVEWRPDEYIHLTRNEDYWGKKPEYRDLYFRAIPDYVTQELELHAGAIDFYEPLPHQVARYKRDPDYQVLSGSEGYYVYIGYNLRHAMFQDVRVRRALSMAINVDDIIKYVLYGEGKRASGPYYSYTPFHDPETPLVPYDPTAAADLLATAGYKKNARGVLEKDGQELAFTLITNNGNPQRAAIMTIAQAAWLKIGVRCTTQKFEWTTFLEDFIEPNKFDAYVLGWVGGDINPDKFEIWHSSQNHPYQLNHVGYADPEADRMIEQLRQEYDRETQVRLARALHRKIAADQPYTFLYEPNKPYVVDKRIIEVGRGPDGREQLRPLRTSAAGEVTYYFDQWRKLGAPLHAAEN
ncbi:MAG: ABC transporter substrate-binding protein [Polyangiaceae bacterium]